MEASATITDSPDEVPTTENPQAIGGVTSMEEDASNMEGRPQRARQGPKRLTYDCPGNPTYVREINTGPPTDINQVGVPPSVPYIPVAPVNQYGLIPPITGLAPPAVPMMFWRANTMMPYGMPNPAVPQLPQFEVPYQTFQYR